MNMILSIALVLLALYLLIDYFWFAKRRTEKMHAVGFCELAFILVALYLILDVYNFETALTVAVIASGIISLLDIVYFAKRRKKHYDTVLEIRGDSLTKKEKDYLTHVPLLIDYSRSFFVILFIVLIIRSFLFEPYRIPSGSLEPTLLTGDLIVVNKYAYGLHLPVTNTKVVAIDEPKRGDIVVFHWPVNPNIDFIKRVIGVPGDHVRYQDKVLYVNGKKAAQTLEETTKYTFGNGISTEALIKKENLLGKKHNIYLLPARPAFDFDDIVVPQGMYFVMGDNRDDSDDSRGWGFVPEKNLVGKAVMVWMSFDTHPFRIRWQRIGGKVR